MRRLIVLCLIFLSFICLPANVGAVDIKIDFDNVIAPGLFLNTNPLRDEYATRGVRFRGLAENDGGASSIPTLRISACRHTAVKMFSPSTNWP